MILLSYKIKNIFHIHFRLCVVIIHSIRRVWPNEKGQKDKQRSTKHTHTTKDPATSTPLTTGGELRCSCREGSSCSTSDTRRVNLVTNPVISHEWGKDREVFTTSGTYPWTHEIALCIVAFLLQDRNVIVQIYMIDSDINLEPQIMIHVVSARSSSHDCLNRGLLLTTKLKKGSLQVVYLKAWLRKFILIISFHHSSLGFVAYIDTTDVTNEAGTTYPQGIHEFTYGYLWVRIASSLDLCCVVFCVSLFAFLSIIIWPLCCQSFDLRHLITPLVSANFLTSSTRKIENKIFFDNIHFCSWSISE